MSDIFLGYKQKNNENTKNYKESHWKWFESFTCACATSLKRLQRAAAGMLCFCYKYYFIINVLFYNALCYNLFVSYKYIIKINIIKNLNKIKTIQINNYFKANF